MQVKRGRKREAETHRLRREALRMRDVRACAPRSAAAACLAGAGTLEPGELWYAFGSVRSENSHKAMLTAFCV